jgi:class 3 adenylate cyclase
MIDTIKEIKQASENEAYKTLDVKVGIHTGKVIAGIIGSKVVRYDIFGEGVVIANKIEQVSGAGTVSISEDTRLLIQSQADVAREYDI